ncbi:outer membrane protein assembly factor BamE domain-containing protein [Noviherbaspirillum humi]|nr:outer membrane protein assembly factor BamE [Noviherbaspirillum humi]
MSLFSFLLGACDKNGNPIQEFGLDKLEKGVSTEAEVRMVMGKPDTVWEDDDGSRTLEYPKGPAGSRTWMFHIDKGGKLRDYEQVLTMENFARIKPGMSEDDVRRMLGKPRSVAQYKRKKEEVWDWKYLEGPNDRLFNVHFDINTRKVTGTSTSDVNMGG